MTFVILIIWVLAIAFYIWMVVVFLSIGNNTKRIAETAELTRKQVFEQNQTLRELLAETKLSNENLSEGFARLLLPEDQVED